jgi:hypothetical protein
MKMNQINYDLLKNKISEIKRMRQETINNYHKLHMSNTRIMWDIFYYANSITHGFLFNSIHNQNLNDSHIQTALFKIGKELNIIE